MAVKKNCVPAKVGLGTGGFNCQPPRACPCYNPPVEVTPVEVTPVEVTPVEVTPVDVFSVDVIPLSLTFLFGPREKIIFTFIYLPITCGVGLSGPKLAH